MVLCMADERYQTVEEVVDLMQWGDATVQPWITDGRFRPSKIGQGYQKAAGVHDACLQGHATYSAEEPHGRVSIKEQAGYAIGASAERKAKGSPC